MDSKSKIKAREATTRDAAGIHRLACELAETVGDTPPMEEAGSNPTSPTETPSSRCRCS